MKRTHLQKQNKRIDRSLTILVLVFTFLGIIAVADASAPQALSIFNDKFYFLKSQALWAGIGLVAFFICSKVNYLFWQKVAIPFFFLSIALLALVLLPHFSFTALGARRWISIGIFNFQPSELIKLGLAMYLAKVSASGKKAISYFVPLIIIVGLIMLQPDLGTTLVISVIAMAQIFVSEVSILYFIGALIVGCLGTLLLILTSPYRKDRLLTFFEISRDPLGKSYHIRQVLLALGSGGFFGVGLGGSRQKYLFLPESATDSMFAVIAEELGLLGAMVVIVLFSFFIYKGLKIASTAPDKFSKVLATGITAWVGGQAFLNIASMTALVPLTGIPLPFFSYGGSSLVMILAACGILLNISKYAGHER